MTAMNEKEFYYQQLENSQYPTLPIIFHYKGKAVAMDCLVDSGADFCYFGEETAKFLGIKLEQGKILAVRGVTGKGNVYLHEIEVQLFDRKIKCRAAFSKEFNFPFSIIGRLDFFDAHEITFREHEKTIKVKELD